MKNRNNKKVILTVMFVAILTVIVIGTSFAFFNYTRTGSANTLKVGRISFNHTQDGSITLTNIFPMSSEEFENGTQDPSNNVTINIEGDTTYPNGVEYLVTAEDVHITVNDKRIPLTLKVTSTTDLGDNDEDYFTNRGGSTNIHKVLSGGVVVDGQYLVVGYIAPGQTGIDGSLNISAYINSDNIVISDTYDGTESDNMGTTNEWVGNKTVFTTSEWNSLSGSSNSLSFKIRVEANEGIWVDPYTTPNLMNGININRNAVNIKEIRFIEETPLRMQRRYDASNVGNGTKADLTYQETGKVLAWIEPTTVNPTGTSSNLNIKPSFLVNENTNNNLKQIDNETSYILYIASSGKTKWTTASGLFASFATVEKITFENVDSSEITSTSGMFYGNTNLKRIDLSGMGSNTLSSIASMFRGCTNLEEINMSNFNFGATTSLYQGSGLFQDLTNLTMINLTNANTSSITNMANMFNYCKKLTNITGINTLDTSNVTSMINMFYECDALTSLNLSNLDISSVQSMYSMFCGCDNLESVIMHGNGNGSLQVIVSIFYNCLKLSNVDLSGLGGNTLTSVGNMFGGCTSLKTINMSNFNFGKANLNETNSPFYDAMGGFNFEYINLKNANTSNVTNMYDMFYSCEKLKTIILDGIDTSKVTDMRSMFQGCSSLTTMNLVNFNMNKVKTIGNMFAACDNLISVSISCVGMSSVENMGYIFQYCPKLESVTLSGFGSDNLENVNYMFQECTKLKNVEMININFGKATTNNLFSSAYNIEKIKMSNVTFKDTNQLFENLSNLKKVTLENIDSSKITEMAYMFNNCSSLTNIDLSGFDTSSVTNMNDMFSECRNLTTIYVSNTWNTSNVTSSNDMFYNCTSLVGGNGTVYDSTKIDKTMAVIDTPSTPGYLTLATI